MRDCSPLITFFRKQFPCDLAPIQLLYLVKSYALRVHVHTEIMISRQILIDNRLYYIVRILS